MKKYFIVAFLLCFSAISFSQTSFLAMDPSNYPFPDVSAFHNGKLLGKTDKKGTITIPKFPAGDTLVFKKDDLTGVFIILGNPEKGVTYIASLEAPYPVIEDAPAEPAENEAWAAPPSAVEKEPVKRSENEPFAIVDEQAEFVGGREAMLEFINKNLNYPQAAKDAQIQGKCYLKLIVEKDGSISNVTVMKGVRDYPECDKEAVRLIKMMPKWKPGKINGNPVRSYYHLPIAFNPNK